MAKYLSDDEAFGAASEPAYLSDEQAFGTAPDVAADAEQEVITSARAWRGAGAGRGSFNDPRRLDTERGRNALAVEGEMDRLEKINPLPRDELRQLAEFNVSQPKQPQKPVDRVEQYTKKGYSDKDARSNAAFDKGVESRLNKPFMDRAPDENTGERIGLSYNPNTDADRVAAEAKEGDLLRRDARQRQYAQEMNPVLRGLAKGFGQAVGLAQGTAALAGDIAGDDGLKEWGLAGYRDNMRQAGNLGVAKQFTEIQSADDAATWALENSGYVAFQAAQSILASGMGGAIGNTIGKKALGEAIGLAMTNVTQTFGSVYGEAVDESKRTGNPVNMTKVLAGAAASAAIDTLADKIGLDSVTANGFKGNALSRLAKSGAMQIGVQGGTEAAQLVPEEFGAGRDPFRKGMLKQYIDEAAVGALGGIGPGAVGSIRRNTNDSPEQALADAINGGAFTQEGIDSAVANTLRTEPGTSSSISPAATSIISPAPQADAKAMVESARDAALADIGNAQSVDEAVAAANASVNLAGRAVQLDSERLLNDALQSAGIADALQPAEAAAPAQDAPLKDGQPAVAVSAAANFSAANTVTPSRVVWTGRRGDGYATPEDASRALNERQRLRPSYDWTVQQNPEGRYVLEGQPKGQEGAAQAVSSVGNTQVAPMAQNAPDSLGDQLAAAGMAQPKETIRDLRDQADQVQRLQAVISATSDRDVSGLRLYQRSGGGGAILPLHEPGGGSADGVAVGNGLGAGSSVGEDRVAKGMADQERIAAQLEEVGRVSEIAFGWRPILVEGLGERGVQYRGRTYVDVGVVSKGDGVGNAAKAVAIQTIGHETTHNLQKSQDPQDQLDYALLRKAILDNANPSVVASRVRWEGQGQTYGENEVVADVSGNFWIDPKFWGRLYDLDASAMRRIAYKFMESATKLIKAVKGSRLDAATFIDERFIDEVREVAAQVWASKAKRGGSLFSSQDQAISKSQSDDSRPGVSAEVAPDPRNQEATQKWGRLTEPDKLGITKEVMDKLAAKVFDKMGLTGWGVEYTSGMFEGGINPSAILRAPQGTDAETLGEVMRVFGYLLDQKGMVAFDESNTASESQAGFVKVVLPEGLSTDKIDAIRKEIAAKVPQAEGDTVRDGAIVYGNFSAYNDKIETLTDEQFRQAIFDVVNEMPESLGVSLPQRFHSEYDQAYWDDAYDPKGREAYLEKTRYASVHVQDEAGRNDVRRWGRDSVFRPWLEALARSTDAQVARLVGDRQPRSAYGAAPDARADRARPEQPAQPGGGDRQGRPDDVRGGVTGVVPAGAGGAGKDIRGAVHYGKVGGLKSLSGAMNGTGIRGAENGRVAQSADPRIRQRVYFYLPVAGGIPQPESGLGQHVYKADLSNLYDTASQKMRLPADSSAMESAILDAGYSGFFNEAQGTVVMFGSVPVSYEGTSDQFNKVQRQPKAVKQKSVTRTEGDMLVRKPEGAEVMGIIKAQKAGLDVAAPSFKMQFGEARVLASESEIADAVFESVGANFRFGEPSYSRDFDELGAFNLDAAVSDMTDAEMEKFGIEPMTEKDMDAIQDELMADFEAEFGSLGEKPAAPTADAIKDAGLFAESAFEPGRIVQKGERFEFQVPAYAEGLTHSVRIRKGADTPGAIADFRNGSSFFINQGAASQEAVEKLVNRQIAGAYLHKAKHDIAGAYRKGTVLKLADSWKRIANAGGAFKLGVASKGAGFSEVAESMGAFKGHEVAELRSYTGFEAIFTREKDGREFRASINDNGQSIDCCTMGLEGSGGLGTEFYAVLSSYAANNDKRFVADDMLSGVNTYRRTEQALSFALRSGDTGVILPGLTNRVYGYNSKPKTREDHDKNLARLALAGMRNVEELFPDVRRLRYDPETDKFTDSRGRDAEQAVKDALANKDARAFGLGRSTIARAVITSQIIKGEEVKADQFASPIAYSLADVGIDEPMAESWGDERGGVTPGLRRFMAGSRIVHEDGRPVVMYHGTAQDVHAFRAKQAGAIFLSYSPRFAGDFAALSGQWMLDHWKQVLTPEQQGAAKKAAAAAVMADKTIKMSERKAMKQSIMDGKPEGMAAEAMNEAVRDLMPSGENILPVFVRATAPFDFRDKAMVDDVVGFLFDKNMAGENDKVRIRLVSEKGDRANMNARVMRELISGGAWDVIESPEVQEVIRELGHDGFFVKEDGQINLAVYEPGQVKSVFNRGTFDPLDERLSYSRAALDDYMVRRNKTMPTISGAAAQEADIALAVKAIDAVSAEIERGNKAILPIPLGRTPHVLGMFRAPNKMLRIDTSILKKVLFDKHSEDFADVSAERFVRAIYQPAMVLRGRSAGEFEIVTDIVTKRGPILIPVMTGGDGPSAAVMSAYAKNVNGAGESLMKRINSGALLYADPVLAQIAVTGRDSERIRGIITSGAQFPSAPPRRAQADNVNQPDSPVKPLNPYYAGWDRAREAVIGGIRERKVKSDVDLMRRIGDLYRGDWVDAPSFSRDDVDSLGMYSALARGVSDMKASAAPVAGWKELIKGMVNKGQAKQDEVEWSGLNDWLDTRQGRVTKDEVLEYLRGNGVQVQEVVLGNPNGFTQDMQERLDDLEYRIASLTDEEEAERQRLISAENRASDDWGDTNQTKYGSYTIPGGENYREVLITLPERKVAVNTAGWTANLRRAKSPVTGLPEFEVLDADGGVVGVSYKASNERDAIEMVAARDGLTKEQRTQYKSNHWDQPNVLAHIRVNDRTDADGKRVLFVEEVQSDSGQDKRKGKTDWNAPFIGDTQGWLNLALKRIITMAVQGGYDKVAFVNGQQSTDRYWGHEAVSSAIERWNAVSKPEGIRELGENVLGRKMYPLVPLDHMDTGVLPMLKRDQVVDAVVSRIPVDVVNVLAIHGLTAEQLVRNGDVVFDRLTVDDRSRAASALGAAIGQTGATIRAKLEVLGSTRADVQLLPALRASDLDSREVLGVVSPGTIFHGIGGSLPKESAAARTITEPAPGKQGRWVEQKLGAAEIAELLNGHVEAKYGREGLLQHSVEPPPGQGMIAFYDKIVPNAVKALVKKLGGGHLQQVVFGGEDQGGRFVVFDDDSGERLFRTDNRKEAAEYIRAYPGDASIKEVEGSAGVGLVGEQLGFDITPAMREKVGEGLPSFSRASGGFDLPAESWSAKTRRKMQDYFLRAQVVQRAIAAQGGVVDEQTDFYRAEELSHGRTAALMQDFADQQVQPLMEKAVKLGVELDELSLYAYAMHAKERNAYIASIDSKLQDGGSGMTNAEADSILQLVDLSGDKAKFEELHNDLMTITRGNRLAMLADGLITQQEFEALEGAYEYYVPLRGFEKLDEDGNPAPARSAGKGFNIRGAETLKAKGRVSRAGQIIENIIHDHQRTIARGERNHVAKVFLNFVLKNPDADLWEIDARTTRKSIDRKTGRIARDTAIEKGEDTIAVKLQGQEVYIRIKDEMLLRALRKSHSDETGQLTSDLMRSIGLYSTLLRNTLTRYNPEFAVVNAMRDVGFGATAVLDELGEKGVAKYLAHYAGALAVSARNEGKKLDAAREWDKWFYEFKAAGGTTSGFYAKGLDEIGGDIRDMMIEAGAAPKDWSEKLRFNKATRAAKAALSVLEYAGSVSENAARVAAYRTAREMGKTPSQAASIAKNLTTNFDRKGEYGQMVNALYLFYNAAIQGTHRTAKMLQNPKVWGYMGGVTAGAVALALASASAGGDDPDDGMAYWDKIPAYVKERNIIIMLPPGAQVEGAEEVGTKGRYLTVPVQYGLNIFHVLGYQIADVVRNQSDPTRGVSWKKGGINIASAMAGAFNPFGGAVDLTNGSSVVQAILPTLFDFPYQLASGTNAFGRDVAPFKSPFDSKPDSQNSNVRQAGSPAEHVAQWLNEVTGGSEYESGAIDVSAGTLENVVRGLTGGTGSFIYDVLALGGKWADYVGGDDPDLFIRDIPIARRLMGETAGDIDQGLFYERRKAIQDARAAEKGAEEAGGEITDKEKLAMASMSSDASKYTRWLSQVRKEMKEVQRDDGLTVQERRLKMRELRAERDRLTSEFNASFTETMRQELSDFGQK